MKRARPRHAIPSAWKKAELIFNKGKAAQLPAELLKVYRAVGAVSSRCPDEQWREVLPSDAVATDYLLISFLACRPGEDNPAVIAEIIISMWMDDNFTLVRWYPDA